MFFKDLLIGDGPSPSIRWVFTHLQRLGGEYPLKYYVLNYLVAPSVHTRDASCEALFLRHEQAVWPHLLEKRHYLSRV